MMALLTSLGLDLSCAATGLVLLREKGEVPDLLFEREIKFKDVTGIERARLIVTEIMEFITAHQPDKIVIEGYSLGKNPSSTIPLVELGGLLRFMLRLDGYCWFDPRASQVKQFATGKGNSAKDQVMMWVLKRWGHTSLSNNTADAYTLAAMGLASANRLKGVTLEQRKIVGGLSLKRN